MSDDWTSLVKNAVSVLVIILAISVVLLLSYFGLNSANKGSEKLASTTSSMDEKAYDTYNQTTISGTTVLSAIKNYQNQPMAILVRTKRSTDIMNYAAYLGATGASSAPSNWVFSGALNKPDGTSGMPSKLITENALYIDYQNTDLTKATKKSENYYINPNAKFRSVLLYDVNEEIVGIYMEQNGVTGGQLQN